MPRGLRILAGIVCVALFPVAAYAQASITGTVKDASGAVLPGVTVEAASPALIEKVRTAVSGGSGQYRIENLRPGAYTVTFTLPGFSTVKREGIELTGTFVATVNADLRVGALEETITVTGETPTVDVQSVVRQRVMTTETMEELPVNRMPAFIASLIPGVNNTSVDVGGSLGPIVTGGGMTVHGSRSTDLLTMSNGLSLQSIQTGSAVQGVANMAQYQEVAIDTAAADASQSLGGLRMNLIPAEGGNQVHGSFTGAFANNSMQGSNYDADLKARGLPTPNGIKRNWDINPAIGGPLRQNKLWFFTTGRYTGAWNYVGILGNKNAGNPNSWTYEPTSEREATQLNSRAMMGRVTWQAMQKQKFNLGYDYTGVCQCNQVNPNLSSEAASNIWYDPKHVVTVDWTSPMTNRLLLDGSFLYLNLYRIADAAGSESLIQVNEQSTGLTYRAKNSDNRNISIQWQYRGSLSYITGAHSFKTGFSNTQASSSMFTYAISPPLTYRFNNGVPNQFTEYAWPSIANSNIDADLGLFAQDKWTLGRVTLSGGLRFDYMKTSFPEMHIGPALYAPNRNIVTPETPGLHWKDITPRTGLAYDVFGNGKTAVKASLNRYVAGQALRGSGGTVAFGSALTPTNLLITSVARSWVDTNRNFIVDCDLTNQAAQSAVDTCGAGNVLFGQNRASSAYDPEILGGWGHRAYNWETSLGVQQELLPRISVEVGYFRRWFGNFAVSDNLAVTPADFTPFTIKAPTNPRLPGGGGYSVTGVNVVPAKFNVTDNFITFAKNYGKQIEHWNGVDVNFNVRPQRGTLLQGGFSTGRLTTDNCEVVAKLPEASLGQQTLQVTNAAANVVPAQFCHEQEPFLTQVKLLGSYLIPKIEVQVSGTLQSIPGQQLAANYVASNAEVAPSLGRALSGGAANVTVAILEPGSLYGDRRNQLDLRVAKVLRISQMRTTLGLDIANATNANPVLTQNPAYATWLRPQTILTARFVKLSVQLNF